MTGQPNFLTFLETLDRHTRESHVAEIPHGSEMHRLAAAAGLTAEGQASLAALWTGELVDMGYVRPRTNFYTYRNGVPEGVLWTDRELQAFGGYRVLPAGREEADRVRRLRREDATDVALGAKLPLLDHPWLASAQREALARPLHDLRAALDEDRRPASIGAAKELVEAACKVSLSHLGQTPPTRGALPTLFKEARQALGSSDAGLGRSMSATVDGLAQLRNASGSGHGRETAPAVAVREVRLAVGAAVALTDFLLNATTDATAGVTINRDGQ